MKKILFSIALSVCIQASQAQCFVKIESGEQHTIALADDGTLWGWGSNTSGEAGVSASYPNHVLVPTQIGTDTDWTDIAASFYHSLALKSDGSLYTWGYNNYGQLGHGDQNIRTSPTQVNTVYQFKAIGAGLSTSFAITVDGSLYGAGLGGNGELGDGTYGDNFNFELIANGNDWKDACGGSGFSMALKNDGTLYATGVNSFGQFGNGNNVSSNAWTQALVGTGLTLDRIDCGFNYAYGLTSSGNLYSWGLNSFGQLGIGSFAQQTSPQSVSTNVVDFSCGEESAIWMTNTSVYSAGRNDYYETQSGTTAYTSSPFQWTTLNQPLMVTKGIFSSSVLTTAGLATWGRNDRGICGNNSSTNVTNPTYVMNCSATIIKEIQDQEKLDVYPNPATNEINVVVEKNTIISILTISGVQVASYTVLPGSNSINIESFDSGVYFIQTSDGKQTRIIKH